MITYKCPKCGTEMISISYTTNPPIPGLQCPKCAFECDEKDYEKKIQEFCDEFYRIKEIKCRR